ncbi:MAG: hypothetical protein PVF27_01115 [Gemmatimonadales bacterium]|jgi:Spy/CpxP family protein refolding chaperone
MFSRSKAQAVSLLVATFLVGAALGGLALAAWSDDDDHRRDDRGRERMSYSERLARELDLSPAQRESVEVFLDRQQDAMRDLWQEVGPRFDTLRMQIRTEIMTVLDSAQRARFQDLIARGERRDAERRNGSRGSHEK